MHAGRLRGPRELRRVRRSPLCLRQQGRRALRGGVVPAIGRPRAEQRGVGQQRRRHLRRPQHGDPEETILIEAFLCAESLLHEQGTTDPRIPFLFAELLIRLDDYDYALDCLKNLEAMLATPSTDVTLAISKLNNCVQAELTNLAKV